MHNGFRRNLRPSKIHKCSGSISLQLLRAYTCASILTTALLKAATCLLSKISTLIDSIFAYHHLASNNPIAHKSYCVGSVSSLEPCPTLMQQLLFHYSASSSILYIRQENAPLREANSSNRALSSLSNTLKPLIPILFRVISSDSNDTECIQSDCAHLTIQ